MKGLLVYVYSCGFVDGFSPIKEARQVIIVGSNVPEIFEASEEHPPVRIVNRFLFGKEYVHAEPFEMVVMLLEVGIFFVQIVE